VGERLREEFGCQMVSVQRGEGDPSIDALYVTPKEPHQQSLFAGAEINLDSDVVEQKVDAVYVTRFQKERWQEKDQPYPKIDRKFLNEPKYSEASVLHPLPRVGELDASVDTDRRAVYFEQAAYGVPVRMALISLLLGIKGKSLHKFQGGFERKKYPVYDQPRSVGIHCINTNCIVHDPMEAQYVRNKFYIIGSDTGGPCKLRCVYCESDARRFVVASKKNKWFTKDATPLLRSDDQHFKELVVFANGTDALASGFHSRRGSGESAGTAQEGGKRRAKSHGAS
jgi:hypothetical protein